MKKFITVLLVVAVMFTFSFSSAFAKVDDYNKTVATANFDAAMDAVKEAGDIELSGKTEKYTVDYATFEAYKAEILEIALYEAEKGSNGAVTAYVDTINELKAILSAEGDGMDLAEEIVAKQYEADKADALAVLGGLDLSAYSTADMPEKHKKDCTCKTYKEHVQYLIDAAIDNIKDAGKDLTADSKIDDYAGAIAEVAKYIAEYDGEKDYATLVVEKGYPTNTDPVGLGIYELNDKYDTDGDSGEATLANYTTAYVEGQAASDAAGIASVKAAIAQAYASYIQSNTEDADKAYAEDVKKVLDFLADEEVIDIDDMTRDFFGTDPDKAAEAVDADKVSKSISTVETFEVSAAQLAAQKDADGKLVRDAEDVADLVTEGTILEYIAAVGVSYTSEYKIGKEAITTSVQCLTLINGLYVGLGDAELEFVKAIRAEFVADLLAYYEEEETYYPAELAKVKAITEEYLAKVNAITDIDDIAKYDKDYIGTITDDVALYKAGGKIEDVKDAEAVAELAKNLQKAAREYAQFVNGQITKPADDYYVGADKAEDASETDDYDKLNELVADLVGNSGARLSKEIEALSDQAVALVKTLPTYAAVEASYDALEDAVDALPGTVKIADKALVDAALAAVEAYEELSGETYADSDSKVSTAVLQLAYAYNNEITAKVKAVSATDKAAVQAILDEIDAFVDTYDFDLEGEDKTAFEKNKIFDENQKKLEGYLTDIQNAATKKVKEAIAAIPVSANLTEAARPAVEAARAAYDAYVAEYTDVEDYTYTGQTKTDGFVADDFDVSTLFNAEVALGLNQTEVNAFDEVAVKAYLQDLSVKARSVKTAKGNVKVTIVADVDALVENGYTVEYKFYRSTKSSKNYGKAKKVSEDNTYTNTSGKKGTKYFYKAVIVAKNADGEVVAKTPLKHCLYASRTWSK